jgi:hypothetical protein
MNRSELKGLDSEERALTLQNALVELQKPVCRMACQLDYTYSSIEGLFEHRESCQTLIATGNQKARVMRRISALGRDYEKNHGAKSRLRLPNSGQWLLRNSKYRNWLNCSSCSVLWLNGGRP